MSDPVRTYSPDEQLRLTDNLLALTVRVHRGDFSSYRLGIDLLRELHGHLFEGVRDHAGRLRARGFGQEHLQFGPNRSMHRDRVAPELERVFEFACGKLEDLLRDTSASGYERAAIELAALIHAQVIQIHPFEDGNGRTSRLLMNIMLVATGLRPIPIEACKQEYTELLNRYFRSRDSAELLAFMLRVYVDGLP